MPAISAVFLSPSLCTAPLFRTTSNREDLWSGDLYAAPFSAFQDDPEAPPGQVSFCRTLRCYFAAALCRFPIAEHPEKLEVNVVPPSLALDEPPLVVPTADAEEAVPTADPCRPSSASSSSSTSSAPLQSSFPSLVVRARTRYPLVCQGINVVRANGSESVGSEGSGEL